MSKKKATSIASSPKAQSYDTPTHIQRTRILKALERAGSQGMTTIELREQVDIMHPSGRVMELRELGYVIQTVWDNTENAQGKNHRCARYVLHSTKGVQHG